LVKTLDVAAFALNASLYVVLGYTFYNLLPITAPGLGTVRFWPQVIVPAVFATLFGPWVGGFGAAVGIFINDMLIHGNPLLSLMAGVTSNFAMFSLIGYVSKKNVNWKIPIVGFGATSAVLTWIASFAVSDTYALWVSAGIIVASYVILSGIIGFTPKWRGFEAGCTMGLLIGASIIGVTVPLFSQFFILPGNSTLSPMTVIAGFGYLIWTFVTEIPFLLVLGPPILQACYRAFPSLRPKREE
jgi:uncharacterized membrane protein